MLAGSINLPQSKAVLDSPGAPADLSALVAGCTVTGPDPLMEVGMPNPASVYCLGRGGTLDIRQRPEGDSTLCVLSDGTRIDEWTFYRQHHSQR